MPRLGGDGETVEVDGGYFGGYVKPANHRENRRDRRLAINQNGKRRVVVVMRERGGRTLPAVFRSESAALSFIVSRVAPQTRPMADEAASWNDLHGRLGDSLSLALNVNRTSDALSRSRYPPSPTRPAPVASRTPSAASFWSAAATPDRATQPFGLQRPNRNRCDGQRLAGFAQDRQREAGQLGSGEHRVGAAESHR